MIELTEATLKVAMAEQPGATKLVVEPVLRFVGIKLTRASVYPEARAAIVEGLTLTVSEYESGWRLR